MTATRATRDDPTRRERDKVQLVRELYRSGLDRQRIVDLFRVIDWMMKLPNEQDRQFRQTIATLEEELQLRYVTSIKRLAKEEGLQQGLERGLEQGLERGLEQSLHQGRARLLRLLTRRFGELPPWAKEKLASATEAQLDAWTDAFLNCASVDEILDQPRPH